jgi:O-6-methylguanine DNA methyltransferase
MTSVEFQTTWGPIQLSLDGDTVVGCALPFLKAAPSKPFKIDDFQTLEKFIKKFPKIGNPAGTEFQRAVWNEMLKIPRGELRTYGEIAEAIGRPKAVRAVGTACGANPIPLFIPCHRIVAGNGLGGFGAGLPWKILLLKTEGAI